MNWPVKKLGNLTFITTGKLDANASDLDGVYPFFTCAIKPLLINKFAFDCEAVLIAGNGDLNVKYYDGKFNAYQRTYVIQSKNKSELSVRFLFHFLDRYVLKLREMSIGGVIKYIKLPYLTDAEIPLPPLAEQQRIAALLDTADRILKQRESAITKLDQLAQSVFVEMFGDPVRNTKNFPMKNIGELPIHIADGNYSSKYPSASEFVESGIPFIRANNLKNLTLVNDDVRYITEKKHGELAKGHLKFRDVVIVTRGEIGKVGLVPMEFDDANMNAQLVLLRPNSSMLLPEYLCHFFNNNYTKSYVKNFETGVALKQLPIGNLKKIQICLPPIGLQNEFANIVKKIENQFESLNVQKATFNSMLLSLQHQSFAVN
jgi:type I restriction enzyme S subunit